MIKYMFSHFLYHFSSFLNIVGLILKGNPTGVGVGVFWGWGGGQPDDTLGDTRAIPYSPVPLELLHVSKHVKNTLSHGKQQKLS